MRLTRVFVAQALHAGVEIELPADAAHHIHRVLRMTVGTPLTVFNGAGGEYAAEISHVASGVVRVRLREHVPGIAASPLRITLIQGVSRGERMDWALQKATELGVHRIVPVLTARSVVRLDAKQNDRKGEHWTSIVRNACEQCGRGDVPEIARTLALREHLNHPPSTSLRLVLDPTAQTALVSLPHAPTDLELLIGPEGGLDDDELAAAKQAGFIAVRLGPRVLRTETAAVAALAILQALWGDLSSQPVLHGKSS